MEVVIVVEMLGVVAVAAEAAVAALRVCLTQEFPVRFG